jgi:phage FluMu gp28-like protein
MREYIGYKPHIHQAEIHNDIINKNYNTYVISSGRQFGKSELAINQSLFWAINNPGSTISYITPYFRLGRKVFQQIENNCASWKGIIKSFNKSNLQIIFKNGSQIIFFSVDNPDSIRGTTNDYLIGDEVAFWDEEIYDKILVPTMMVKGKKTLLISTPKGKNFFYKLFLNGQQENSKIKSYKKTIYDNPFVTEEQIQYLKKTTPQIIFAQEYESSFIDNQSSVFKNYPINNNINITNKTYAGIDIAQNFDYSCISVLNDKGEQIYIDRFNNMSFDLMIEKIISVLNKYKPDANIEINSIGSPVYEQIRKRYNKIYPFVTSSKSKNELIENLIIATENEEIKLLEIDWLKGEFENFGYEWNTKTRTIRYNAIAGHDDGVISTALSYNAFLNLKNKGTYAIG